MDGSGWWLVDGMENGMHATRANEWGFWDSMSNQNENAMKNDMYVCVLWLLFLKQFRNLIQMHATCIVRCYVSLLLSSSGINEYGRTPNAEDSNGQFWVQVVLLVLVVGNAVKANCIWIDKEKQQITAGERQRYCKGNFTSLERLQLAHNNYICFTHKSQLFQRLFPNWNPYAPYP